MKKILLSIALFAGIQANAQTIPNGDMESINSCFAGGFIFSYWNDYGCTDAFVNPSSTVHAGNFSMLITNTAAQPSPLASQAFPVATGLPTCLSFFGKINLNAGDSVKVKVYYNCNGGWFNCGNWNFTNANVVSQPYTQYYVPLNTALMCITGMDSTKVELIGGKVMNGATPTSFYVDDVSFNCTTGIEQFNQENSIVVFPNPADKQIQIKCDSKISAIRIFDTKGVVVKEIMHPFQNSIQLTEMNNGFYFLQIVSDGGIINRKIEIQH